MDYYLLAKLGHFLGIALGVGGAVASDLLFLRAIKDRKISRDEVALLSRLSNLLWGGLLLLLASGTAFMLIQLERTGVITYLSSEPFRAKITIFAILFMNAFLFHSLLFPRMKQATSKGSFHALIENHAWLFGAIGSISIVSWMTLLLLGVFRTITPNYFTYEEILLWYGGVLAFAIVISYWMLKGERS